MKRPKYLSGAVAPSQRGGSFAHRKSTSWFGRCLTCNKRIRPWSRSASSTQTTWDGEVVEEGWLCSQACKRQYHRNNWALYRLAMSRVPSGISGKVAFTVAKALEGT